MRFIVLLGAPGAGKGTQANLLHSRLGLPHVSTGDLFRYNLKNATELGKLAQSYMDKGELVPDNVTIGMVEHRLAQADCAQGAILDGFPRNVTQAQALDDILSKMGATVTVVPSIHVDQEELIGRLLKRAQIEGRADDNEQTIRTRMQVYVDQTKPLHDFYAARGVLVAVDGAQSIEEVHQALIEVIESAG